MLQSGRKENFIIAEAETFTINSDELVSHFNYTADLPRLIISLLIITLQRPPRRGLKTF
jgi:hypothetical protein